MKIPKLILYLIPLTALALTLLLFFSQTPIFTRITKPTNPNHHHFHLHTHVQIAHTTCKNTLYPNLCVSTLSSFPNIASKNLSEIIFSTLNHTIDRVQVSRANYTGIRKRFKTLKPYQNRAFDDCLYLFNITGSAIETVIADVLASNTSYIKHYHDIQTLLSAAMTNAYTCLDGISYGNSTFHDIIKGSIEEIEHLLSNALVFVKQLPGINSTSSGEVFPEYGHVKDGFPTWLSNKDRRLLQTEANATNYNLVVAKDGSGNFTTIQAAVDKAPNSSTTRFVIYIKAGAYFENVEVISRKTNLMFVGDGIGKTVVKASRNVVDGYTTFQSATVAVVGSNFIAKGITIENAAGPEKHQAVALRSGSDFSAFYQCSFVGYQDTLYVHSLRQFYRECDVYGTIDFIFGNAAVVLQNCKLYARMPSANQKNVFTAQGRDDPNQNTGISILNCKVAAAADLIPVQSSFKNYLGRPWKAYSRTVYLQSKLDDLIDPAGWLEWDGDFALSTLYYGEYNNRGAGSNTSARVTWPGYRVITNSTEASQFTVGPFIQGDSWIPATGIPYFSGLL